MQEGASVSFDIEYPRQDMYAEEMGLLLALSLAGYGAWRALGWGVEKWRERINWRWLRIWFPAAVVLGAAGLILLELRADPDADWQRALGANIGILSAIWLACYAIVRLFEWRAWNRVPIALELHVEGEDRKGG